MSQELSALATVIESARTEYSNIVAEEAAIKAAFTIRLPILQKQKESLQAFLQSIGEATDYERNAKKEHGEAFARSMRPFRAGASTASELPSAPASKRPPGSPKKSYSKTNNVPAEIVEAIARLVRTEGPLPMKTIYGHLLEQGLVDDHSSRAPTGFTQRLRGTQQESVVRDRASGLWGTPEQFQRVTVRPEVHTNGATNGMPANHATPADHANHATPATPTSIVLESAAPESKPPLTLVRRNETTVM